MRIGSLLFIVVCLALANVAFPAQARETVFDNFGPEWDYNTGLGWSVAGVESQNPFGVEQAMGFYPTADGSLTDIWVAFARVPYDPGHDTVTLRIALDDHDQPGTVLEEWTLEGFETWDQWNPPHHMLSDGSTTLVSGQRYWLWAIPSTTTYAIWNMNNVGDVGDHTLRREGEDWLPVSSETRSAFRVDVTDLAAVSPSWQSSIVSDCLPHRVSCMINCESNSSYRNHHRFYWRSMISKGEPSGLASFPAP